MNYKINLLLVLFIAFALFSCKEISYKDRIKEGYIQYDIEYMDDSLNEFMYNLLPQKMTIKFKDDNTVNKMEGFSGVVSFTHIQNVKKEKNITLVKFMNKRYKYIEQQEEESLFFEEIPGMKISSTDEVKTILGYECKKAIVTSKSNEFDPFPIYYTQDISIRHANSHTPFKSIDGVLMQFQVRLYDINMQFNACNVKEAKISDEEFTIPEGYEAINRKTMKEIIALIK